MVCWLFPVISVSLAVIALVLLAKPDHPTTSTSLPPALVEAETKKLLEQAQRDIQSPETKCFRQSIQCPLSSYEFDSKVRLEALQHLKSNQ